MASIFTHSYLVDISKNTISELQDNKLPTKSEVLKLLFHYSKTENKNIDDTSKLVTEKIRNVWDKIPIKTAAVRNSVSKLKKLYNEYRSLQKYDNMSDKKIEFLKSTSDVFDIPHDSVFSSFSVTEKKNNSIRII